MALSPPLLLMKSIVAWSRNAIRSQSTLPEAVCSRIARSPMPSCLRVVEESERPGGSSAGVSGLVEM
jgi:hypothetical protein